MKNCKNIFLYLFMLLCAVANSQAIKRYNTVSYNVNEGLLQSTIADIAFDKNNFCWLSFPNGIQKFDGKNFTTVPVQPGLPDDKLAYFFRCSNNDLLISHSQGISRYEINNNRFIQVYTSHLAAKKPAQFIGEDENIIYFYSANGTITGIDCGAYKTVSEIKTGFPDYTFNGNNQPKCSDNIINHKVGLLINFTLYLWDLKEGKLLSKSANLPDISLYFLKLKSEKEILYNNYKVPDALKSYNFTSHSIRTFPINGVHVKIISRCNIYSWRNNTMLSINNKLYEIDSALKLLKLELVDFQNQPVAGNHGIGHIKEDNFGNLYLVTIRGGIKKIIRNNYDIKYYSAGRPEDNFVLSILPDKTNNRILIGTSGNGLLVFDTMQRLINHIKTFPGKSLPASPNCIIKANGSYLLFVVGEKYVWELSNDLLQIKRFPISTSLPQNKSGISYFANVVFQNENESVIQTQNKLFRTNFSANITNEHFITEAYIMSGVFFNSFIITHGNDELIFLDVATFKEIKRVPFKNTGNVRCFARDAADNIYVGCNKGIYKIDSTGKILQHLNKENGLPDECIYAMAFDEDGFLWCSTNKGILKINKDNSFQQLKKEDGLQENEFNTNAVATAADGEIFFGGVNGVSSFFPSAINNLEEKINLLFTGIKINNKDYFKDTAVWKIDHIDLPHNQNSLAFDFITMADNNPGQYIYQYKMKGLNEEWIQNNSLQTVRYFLPPGKYVFQIYASRSFNKDAKAMKEISITIHLPFWKSWWFLTIIAVMLLCLLAYSINQYNSREYQKKLTVFETENKMRLERERISRDLHDNIGAYANAVLYKTELLQKEELADERNELITDLRFASKDIITSLRETVWALKKDNYTAEDCLIRIRNFIQPFTRYYPNMQFKVEGEAPSEKNLHYEKALHLVRIIQEAVSNAIRHAGAGNIIIYSRVLNNSWKLQVTDDGKGFDYAAIKFLHQGNGLSNMKQRAVDAGLEFYIHSVKDIGTTVIVTC